MFGRPQLSTSTRCRSWMSLLTEIPYLERVQSSGQGFDEKKERKATDVFFRSPRSFPTSADWRSRSQCRHWTSEEKITTPRTVRKRNWQNKRLCGYKKCAGRWDMTPQCSLQTRSAFGTDILMQETGSIWWREPKSSTLPKKTMKEDEKSHMDMQTLWGRWGWSYWEKKKKKTTQEENLLKWSHVTRHLEVEEHERCTTNRFVCIEYGRCQTFITKDTVQCERRFVNQEEVSEVRRSGKEPYLDRIQLNPEEWRDCINTKRVV